MLSVGASRELLCAALKVDLNEFIKARLYASSVITIDWTNFVIVSYTFFNSETPLAKVQAVLIKRIEFLDACQDT